MALLSTNAARIPLCRTAPIEAVGRAVPVKCVGAAVEEAGSEEVMGLRDALNAAMGVLA